MTGENEGAARAQVKEAVIGPAAADARDTRAHRWMFAAAAVAILGIVGLGAAWIAEASATSALQAQVSDLTDRGNQTAVIAQQLAGQVRSLGGTPTVQPPSPGLQGPQGVPGAAGPAGRGIASTQLSAGHLVVTYTDGTTNDLGQVAGPAGRGITGTTINGQHLIVSYSDGQTADVGAVVGHDGTQGPAGPTGTNGTNGRGVESVTINGSSHLIVTYTDGTTSDAGQLPPGPQGPAGPTGRQGPAGPQGAPPSSWTWTDELGRTQSCTRSGGTDAQPTYTCTASPPTIKRPGA